MEIAERSPHLQLIHIKYNYINENDKLNNFSGELMINLNMYSSDDMCKGGSISSEKEILQSMTYTSCIKNNSS